MDDNRTNLVIITVSAILGLLAIVAPVVGVGQPIQFIAVLGGIILGPGGLAYRLATGSKWSECLIVGVPLNIAALMVLALAAVAVHFWHPKVELIIPVATCVFAITLYRRRPQGDDKTDDHSRSQQPHR